MAVEYSFDVSYPPEKRTLVTEEIKANVTKALESIFADTSSLVYEFAENYAVTRSERTRDTDSVDVTTPEQADCAEQASDTSKNVCHRLEVSVKLQHNRYGPPDPRPMTHVYSTGIS
jgi:hypothetical protein